MARRVDGPEITGQVVHKQTGQVYGGVTVTVSPKVYTDPEMTASVTSLTADGTGVFSCYAPPGVYTFTTTAVDAQTLEPVEVLGREGGTGVPTAASGLSPAVGLVANTFGGPYGVSPDVVAHMPTGTAGTDSPMLVSAIADTPEGGWLHLPSGNDTPYAISVALALTKNIRITGGGVGSVLGSRSLATGGWDPGNGVPITSPYLKGTVILQTTINTDAIQITGAGIAAHLEDFGIRFNTRFRTSGHGINVAPPVYSTALDIGLQNSHWKNIWVDGHDGNHYAFVMTNLAYCRFEFLRSNGGGGLHLINNSPSGNWKYGNSSFPHPFFVVCTGGTAHALHIDNVTSGGGMLVFERLQTATFSATALDASTPPTSAQKLFTTSGSFPGGAISLVGAGDFETNVSSQVSFPAQSGSNQDGNGNPNFYVDPATYFGAGVLPAPKAPFWNAVTFLNSWANKTGTSTTPCQYAKIGGAVGGDVVIQGDITGGTTHVVATLPAGFRPGATTSTFQTFPITVVNGGVVGTGYMQIQPSGNAGQVTIFNADGTIPGEALFFVRFPAES